LFFEVITAVTLKNAVFWDVTTCCLAEVYVVIPTSRQISTKTHGVTFHLKFKYQHNNNEVKELDDGMQITPNKISNAHGT
jgi:hypothetical protein